MVLWGGGWCGDPGKAFFVGELHAKLGEHGAHATNAAFVAFITDDGEVGCLDAHQLLVGEHDGALAFDTTLQEVVYVDDATAILQTAQIVFELVLHVLSVGIDDAFAVHVTGFVLLAACGVPSAACHAVVGAHGMVVLHLTLVELDEALGLRLGLEEHLGTPALWAEYSVLGWFHEGVRLFFWCFPFFECFWEHASQFVGVEWGAADGFVVALVVDVGIAVEVFHRDGAEHGIACENGKVAETYALFGGGNGHAHEGYCRGGFSEMWLVAYLAVEELLLEESNMLWGDDFFFGHDGFIFGIKSYFRI